jgi:hypothetical protein
LRFLFVDFDVNQMKPDREKAVDQKKSHETDNECSFWRVVHPNEKQQYRQ